MKTFTILIAFTIPILCGILFFSKKPYEPTCDTPNSIELASKIKEKICDQISERYQIDCIGSGGSSPGGIIGLISLRFQIHHALTKPEASIILVDCMESLLKAINNDDKIRPCLKNFPFTEKNIDIAIFSKNVDGSEVFHPFLRVASASNGNLFYHTKDPLMEFGYKSQDVESYEEALKIVKEQRNEP